MSTEMDEEPRKIRYHLIVRGDFDPLHDLDVLQEWIERMQEFGSVSVVKVSLVKDEEIDDG